MDYEKRRNRKDEVANRAKRQGGMYTSCRVIGCGRPPTSAVGKGLDRLYCRPHSDHYSRHGSYLKPSYTATQLAPFRKAAREWLEAHKAELEVQLAVRAVETL